MKKIARVEEVEEGYKIVYSDDTNEVYRPNAFEMWLIEQILAIKQKVGA